MLMAGLDGVINKIEPPDPVDVDLYELLERNGSTGGPKIQSTPGKPARSAGCARKPTTTSCCAVASSPTDVIEEWISYKREHEVDPVALRPHPYEFHLYYDI